MRIWSSVQCVAHNFGSLILAFSADDFEQTGRHDGHAVFEELGNMDTSSAPRSQSREDAGFTSKREANMSQLLDAQRIGNLVSPRYRRSSSPPAALYGNV